MLKGNAVLFGLIGALILVYQVVGYRKAQQASEWPFTFGEVSYAGFERRGKRSRKVVRYRYYVDGKEYTSEHIAFGGSNESGTMGLITMVTDSGQPSLLERYHTGDPVTVYHNPKWPNEAVLETEFGSAGYVWMVVGAIALLVAFVGGVLGFCGAGPAASRTSIELGPGYIDDFGDYDD